MRDHLEVPLHREKSMDKKLKPSSSHGQAQFTPPDGGWGWVVCFTSMLTNGTVFGVINTFGIIYVVMVDSYPTDDENVSFKTCKYPSYLLYIAFLILFIHVIHMSLCTL